MSTYGEHPWGGNSNEDSAAWYRTLHDSSPVGLATIRLDDCRIRSANPAMCDMLGYTEDELLGKTVQELTHPEDRRLDEDAIRKRHDGNSGLMQFEKRLLHKTGRPVWIELSSAPMQVREGEPLTILGIVQDITHRKEAERKLRESESNLALAARTAGLGYWACDLRTDEAHWSPECCELFGVPHGPVRRNRDFMDLVHPEDREHVAELHERYLAECDEASMECRIVRPDNGQVRQIKLVGQYFRDERGEPLRLVGSAMDITMDRRAEEALTFAHQQLRAVLDTLPACVHVVDRDFRVMELNHNALRCSQLPRRADVLGRKCYEVFRQKHTPCENCSIPRVLETGQPATRITEGDPLCRGGEVCKILCNPIRDHNGGGVLGVVEVVMDITDLKQAEKHRQELTSRAQRLAKLESLASLAGGIAHDFNNLLVAVMGNADLALRELPPDSGVRELMGEIKSASLRAADLTGQMLAYAGRGRLVLKPVDINAMIRDLCNELKRDFSERIECRRELDENLPEVPVDREQFSQLVRNLLVNAAEAIGSEYGRLSVRTRIETRAGTDSAPGTYVGETLREGQYISIEVQDTGCGMDEQTQGRLFDPFFTTKFTGRGLGLAAALGIARGHGGGIEVASRPGEGSTFTVRIPLPASEKRNGQTVEDVDQPHRWTVLFADDEPNVRTIVRRMLSQAGFKVLIGEDGQEAIDLFEAHRDDIDVVILDMVMPTCDGQSALEAIRAAGGNVPVLFCSGYSEIELSGTGDQPRPDGYIQKPFDMQEFLDTLEHFARG
jgi:PAS domain S-box-containing protein